MEKLSDHYELGFFLNRRSQKLYTLKKLRHDEKQPSKAVVFFAHGLGDHCSRGMYLRLYDTLSLSGCDVYAMDHHGHGQSEGQRAYCVKFEDYVDDFYDFIQSILEKDNVDGPLVLMGQSMGGLCATLTALRLGKEIVKRIVLTSPACGVELDFIKHIQKKMSPILNFLLPKAKLVDSVRAEDLTRNKMEVDAFLNDPLIVRGKTRVRTAIEISKSFDELEKQRPYFTIPIMMMHGTDDRTTSLQASYDFFLNIGTKLEENIFCKLENYYHELLNEPGYEKLLEMIVEFVIKGGVNIDPSINHERIITIKN